MIFFPSTLFITKTDIDFAAYLQPLGHLTIANNPDIFILDDYSIVAIRTIKNFLSQKPYQHSSKIIIIKDAHNLQTEAQNALLKMLEEPGENNYFLLTTNRPNQLLSTIISRCHQIKINSSTEITKAPLLQPANNLKDNLFLAESVVSTKEGTLDYLQNQLELYHQQLIINPSPLISQKINLLQKAINMINNNVDPKSAVDFFLLS
jgi:DNA polymerase III delta prime subunit